VESDSEIAGPQGFRSRRILVQTNPGTKAGLDEGRFRRRAARFLLALKVVLSDRGSAPPLVFDEIDTASAARWLTPLAPGWRGSPARCR